jgi:hypothetical protein
MIAGGGMLFSNNHTIAESPASVDAAAPAVRRVMALAAGAICLVRSLSRWFKG